MHRLLSHRSASHGSEVLSFRTVHAAVLDCIDIAGPDGQCAVSNDGHERDGSTDGAGSIAIVRWILSRTVTCAETLRMARCLVLCEVHVCRRKFERITRSRANVYSRRCEKVVMRD